MDRLIGDIPDGNLIVVESDVDPARSVFIHGLCRSGRAQGRKVIYVSSRARREVEDQLNGRGVQDDLLTVTEERDEEGWLECIQEGCLLIIDSFSYLLLGRRAFHMGGLIEKFRERCREKGAIVILAVDSKMMSEDSRSVLIHLSDGVLEFVKRDSPEGVVRFMRIPKWEGLKSVDQHIFFNLEGEEINIDMRSRVI